MYSVYYDILGKFNYTTLCQKKETELNLNPMGSYVPGRGSVFCSVDA